ncbi:hypothetical protein [Sulfitobacter sp.]|uniref:hypothetical protein n=1 Tax=Sulfitobacter sp. TaxID=1903071 RepID=UPI0030027CD3
MKAALFAALIACTPVTATALSCMPHSVEAAFLEAQAAEARFVIVRGRLSFNARRLPKVDLNNQHATPKMTWIKAKLTGKSLSYSGFSTPYSKPVTLAVACFGPWCANVKEGSDVLAFVELGVDGGIVATNPCGG